MSSYDWKANSEDDIILHYKPLIGKVINSCFANHSEYLRVHMFSYDDLEQLGMIGIMEAIRTFDETKGTEFKTHVVNSIKYSILNKSKQVSLRNKNNYTSELVNIVSMGDVVEEGNGATGEFIHHLIESVCEYEKVEDELFIKNAVLKLYNEKTISKEYIAFLVLKMNGYSINKIASIFNTRFYYVETVLKKYQSKASKLLNLEETFNEFK